MMVKKLAAGLSAMAVSILVSFTAGAQTPPAAPDTLGDVCQASLYAPIVGSWSLALRVSGVPFTTQGLVNLDLAGILTETDDLDLPQNVSPAFGVWQATDCLHYNANFKKLVYQASTQTYETTTLKGSVVLSRDGQSFSGQLNQQFFNTNGQVLRSDVVQLVGTRRSISTP